MTELPRPKVTVLVMTYNHRPFIEQALDSALVQRTDFDWELIISEDCSTDGTRELVQQYAALHPHRIRLLLSEKNVRSNRVVARGIEAARGDYIALLDGDDYWISPEKLQKQADFLDEHPECSFCFHNAQVLHEGSEAPPWNWTPPHQPSQSSFEDIWMGNFIATCATMFRRQNLGTLPAWYDAMFPITDWPLHILNARHGRIGYLNQVLGVYRYHVGGLYSAHDQWTKLEKTLQFYRTMNANLEYRYDTLVRTAISRFFFEWSEEYANHRDRVRARRCFAIALTGRPLGSGIALKEWIRMALRLYVRPWKPA